MEEDNTMQLNLSTEGFREHTKKPKEKQTGKGEKDEILTLSHRRSVFNLFTSLVNLNLDSSHYTH